jgi:hypothetical protein
MLSGVQALPANASQVGRAVRAKGITQFSSIAKGAHGTPYNSENFVQ